MWFCLAFYKYMNTHISDKRHPRGPQRKRATAAGGYSGSEPCTFSGQTSTVGWLLLSKSVHCAPRGGSTLTPSGLGAIRYEGRAPIKAFQKLHTRRIGGRLDVHRHTHIHTQMRAAACWPLSIVCVPSCCSAPFKVSACLMLSRSSYLLCRRALHASGCSHCLRAFMLLSSVSIVGVLFMLIHSSCPHYWRVLLHASLCPRCRRAFMPTRSIFIVGVLFMLIRPFLTPWSVCPSC